MSDAQSGPAPVLQIAGSWPEYLPTTPRGHGTAQAANADYESLEGTLEFAPGETEATLTIELRNLLLEPFKSVEVRLLDPVHAVFDESSGLGALRSAAADTIALTNATVRENVVAAEVGELQQFPVKWP